ncbi:MAG: helix-turn-helix transcriptional regulator [Myxococcota bacterium]|nr:helix-turn-helix transcriptional regulator [Myxococcota bacterium]
MDSMSNQDDAGTQVQKMINRVREFRENKLMTQAQLARKAKVALRTIHSVEKGMNCRMDTKRKILLALGLRFEDKELVFPSNRPSFFNPLMDRPATH